MKREVAHPEKPPAPPKVSAPEPPPSEQHPEGSIFNPPHKVLMTPELMEQWASRDIEGNRMRWEWGEPDSEGFHLPTVHVDYEDNPTQALRDAARRYIDSLAEFGTEDEGIYYVGDNIALDDLREALECKHQNAVSAKNEVVESGLYCPGCRTLISEITAAEEA